MVSSAAYQSSPMAERMRKRKTFADSELNCASTGFMYAAAAAAAVAASSTTLHSEAATPSSPQSMASSRVTAYCPTSIPSSYTNVTHQNVMQMHSYTMDYTNDFTLYQQHHHFDYSATASHPRNRNAAPIQRMPSSVATFANSHYQVAAPIALSPIASTSSLTSCCSASPTGPDQRPPAKIRLIDGSKLLKSSAAKPKISFSIESIIGMR